MSTDQGLFLIFLPLLLNFTRKKSGLDATKQQIDQLFNRTQRRARQLESTAITYTLDRIICRPLIVVCTNIFALFDRKMWS